MRTHRVTDRSIAALLALLGTCGVSVALANPPAAPDAIPAAAAPAASAQPAAEVNPTATPAAANATVKSDAAAAAAAERAALERRLTNSGYKPRMRDGTKVWCKRQDELGSRLGVQEVCATPEEWRRSFRDNQEVVEHIQKIDGHLTGK
jgi:hypothetical protein